MNGRIPFLVAVSLVCVVLVAGAGGFSTVDAQRDIAVTVADDENAYLGVETHAPELRNGNHRDVPLVTLTNHVLAGTMMVTVDVPASNGPPPVVEGLDGESLSIAIGESKNVTTDVSCGPAGAEEVTIDITATSRDGTKIELRRTVTITCTGGPQAPSSTTQDRSARNGSMATPTGG